MDATIPATKPRIQFIDGLRGVAILMVILFHAFARWPDLYVYGDKFVGNILLDTKVSGVNLFFIISGFVILMTLHKCKNFTDFITRRWLRLFPAMLICSILIWATSGLFPERPAGAVIHFYDLFPGLTFSGGTNGMDPLWHRIGKISGVPINSIEGAFWSLYVEVKFYIVFGLSFFLIGQRRSLILILGLFFLGKLTSISHMVPVLNDYYSVTGIPWVVTFLATKTYGWFATGALFFLYSIKKERRLLFLAIAVGLLSCLSSGAEVRIPSTALALLFLFAMSHKIVRQVLSHRLFVFLGFISYPLYLIHENMMVAMIIKIGRQYPQLPSLFIPVLPIFLLIGVAWIIARFIEPATKNVLSTGLLTLSRSINRAKA